MDKKKGDDFYSFEKALEELKLKEDELRRLVSDGGIRAFRDEDTMKFRAEDVQRLKTEPGGDTGSLDFDLEGGDASSDTLAEDLVFDEDDDLGLGDDDEIGMATAQISEDTLDDDLGMATAPVGDDDFGAVDAMGDEGAAGLAVRRTTGRGTQIRARAEEAKAGNPLLVAVMVMSSLVLFYGIFVSISLFSDRTNGMTRGVADFFNGLFGN